MTLENLEAAFSESKMLSYAGACNQMAMELPEIKSREKFDTLIIPSRGAVPFFLGGVHALRHLGGISSEHKSFYDGLEIYQTLESLLPPSYARFGDEPKDKTNVLLVPFTADLNVERYDSTQSNDEYTEKTRQYWARFTAALFKEGNARLNDSHFRSFVDIVLREIERRETLAKFYEAFPRINCFAMIDTVISGRASNDILKAFDGLARETGNKNQPYAFLVVDENGRRLRPSFEAYLRQKERLGKVKICNVESIVSEDKGAALLGVCAAMYPSIMKASKSFEWKAGDFFMGAGSWHLSGSLSSVRQYSQTFERFMEVVYRGIDYLYARDFEGNSANAEAYRKEFESRRTSLINFLYEEGILAHSDADVSVLHLNPNYVPKAPYETRAHVVHIPFSSVCSDNLVSNWASRTRLIWHKKTLLIKVSA